jgi:thioredoxin 1
MSMVQPLTMQNIQSVVAQSPLLVVKFWAPWCGPCKMFAPIFERVAASMPGVAFGQVNIDEERPMINYLRQQGVNVAGVPTLLILKNGAVVHHKAGVPAAQDLLALIQSFQG